MEYERYLQAICFATDDAKEGRAAFTEKRPPQFHRRGKPREGRMTMWRAMAAVAVVVLPTAALAQTVWDKPNSIFHVSPDGDDKAAGSAAAPFRSLERAQAAVDRKSTRLNSSH